MVDVKIITWNLYFQKIDDHLKLLQLSLWLNVFLYRNNSSVETAGPYLLFFARTTTTTTGTTNDGVPTARSGPVSLWKATLCPRIKKRSHYLSKLHGFLRFETVSKGMGLTKVSHHLLYGMKGFFKERIDHIEMLKSTLNSAVFLGWSQSTQITGLPMQGPGDEMRDLVVLNNHGNCPQDPHGTVWCVWLFWVYVSRYIPTYIYIYASLTLPSSQKCYKSISHKKSFAPLEVWMEPEHGECMMISVSDHPMVGELLVLGCILLLACCVKVLKPASPKNKGQNIHRKSVRRPSGCFWCNNDEECLLCFTGVNSLILA